MKKVILLRYGELYLKGKNRGYFERMLIKNIKLCLNNTSFTVTKSTGRVYVTGFDETTENVVINKLTKVFGLHSLSLAEEVATNMEDIENCVASIQLNNCTFRVSVKRADKTFPIFSNDYEKKLGAIILQHNPTVKVNLKNFDKEIIVDIRENKKTYVLYDVISCYGGMPYGTAGKGLLMLSGGIDSPVAGYMMAKRGLEITGLHFHSFPYTSMQAKQKVIKLANIMTEFCGKIKLLICSFTEIQEEIHKKCSPEFMITIMRRIMMRISEKICIQYGLGAVITGENLGQVASQTLESITVTNKTQSTVPVFRPLIAFDKQDIINVADKIGTYETSVLPYEDCCTVFLPKNPVIKPKLSKVLYEESKLDIETLVQNAISKIEIVEL